MTSEPRYTVVVEDCPEYPTPHQAAIHTDRLRLRRLAHGKKT